MDIQEYWSTYFGVSKNAFNAPGIHLLPHASLDDYWGLWIFTHRDTIIISSPESFLPECKEALSRVDPKHLNDPDIVSQYFDPYIERIIGPAYHGTLTPRDFIPADTNDCREISQQDVATLDDGRDPEGWSWSGNAKDKSHFFGVFHDDKLAAVSNYEIKEAALAFPGVYVHPDFRGYGFAKVALSKAFDHSLSAGLLLDYQTLLTNIAAIKAAESLGVNYFAQHIAIRLKT